MSLFHWKLIDCLVNVGLYILLITLYLIGEHLLLVLCFLFGISLTDKLELKDFLVWVLVGEEEAHKEHFETIELTGRMIRY